MNRAYSLAVRERLITAACQLAGAVTGRLASREDTVPPPNPRIVVLRRCCLGDVLESTAMLAALRRQYPLAQIDYATSVYSAPALAGNPDVSAIVAPTVAALSRGKYDVAVTLERSPLAGLIPWRAGVPIRVGPNSLSRGFAHNVRVPCPPDRPEACIHLDCAAALGVDVEGARPKFCPSDADCARAAELLPEPGPYVAIAPGGGVNPGMRLIAKRWPAERFADLARELSARHGLQAVLVGSADDSGPAAAIVSSAAAVDLTGRTSFGEMGAIVARCRLFV